MCDPVSLTVLAVSVAGTLAANSANNKAIESQSAAAARNTAEGYRVAQQDQANADAAAFEQQSDRMRQTAQQLSLARVVAAEGGGSLAANAINIAAAGDEDYSRIDAGLTNQQGAVRDKMAALQVGNADAVASATIAGRAGQVSTIGSIAGAAAGAYVTSEKLASEKRLAQNYSSTYKIK